MVCLLCSSSQPSQSVLIFSICNPHSLGGGRVVCLPCSPSHYSASQSAAIGVRAVSPKRGCVCVCAVVVGRATFPGAPQWSAHTRGSLPLAQPKPRPLGRPFALRGSPVSGLAWRSPPRGGLPPWRGGGGGVLPPVPARVPAPQLTQQNPSPSPLPAPIIEYTQHPPATATHQGGPRGFACRVVVVDETF